MSDGVIDYMIGDKVWVKLPGYPPWPGRIEEPKNMRERKSVKPGTYLVFFYGTHETAIARKHELFKWNEENCKEWFIDRNTIYFTDSLWEVENDANVKRDAPLPAITKPPDLSEVTKYNPIVPPTFSDDEDAPGDDDDADSSASGESSSKTSESSSSSSSSSDSDFDKRKKQRRKKQHTKKVAVKTKAKNLDKKTPRKRKASSSSNDDAKVDVDLSSSSDEESILKFKRLTATVSTKQTPKLSAAIPLKQESKQPTTSTSKSDKIQSKTKKTVTSPRQKPPPNKMKKEVGSSDEEAALKKFTTAVAESESVKQEEQQLKQEQKQPDAETVAANDNEEGDDSNLAAFLSESGDENASPVTSKAKKSKANNQSPSAATEVKTKPKKIEEVEKKSSKEAESEVSKSESADKEKKSEEKEHGADDGNRENLPQPSSSISAQSSFTSPKSSLASPKKDSKKVLSPPTTSPTKLKKKSKDAKEIVEKEKSKAKETVATKARRSIIDDNSDNSSNEDESSKSSRTNKSSSNEDKRTSKIVLDVNKLSIDKVLDKLHLALMKSLSQKSLNHERALICLTEMKEYLTSDSLRAVPDVLVSIKKIRKYKKDVKIQEKAEELFNTMRSLVSSNVETVTRLVEEKKKRHSELNSQPAKPATTPIQTSAAQSSISSIKSSSSVSESISAPVTASNKDVKQVEESSEVSAASVISSEVSSSSLCPETKTANAVVESSNVFTSIEDSAKQVLNEKENEAMEVDNEAKVESDSSIVKSKLNEASKPAVQYFFLRAGDEGSAVKQGQDSTSNKNSSLLISHLNEHAHTATTNGNHDGEGDDGNVTPTRDELFTETVDQSGVPMVVNNTEGNVKHKQQLMVNSEVAIKAANDLDIDSALGI